MDIDDIKLWSLLAFVVIIFIIGSWFAVFSICMTTSMTNAETMIISVNGSDIIFDENDFYILSPDGNKISLGVDKGEVLDLTKHSDVLVKFKRYPPFGIYGGSDWFVDGVVKTP